ncbi:MAG: hypothetical protein ACD_75C00333G0004 [uncultured bacterium]|nr:MAG: hypothetical protein ACD_75C00333G0004 [uncultured bacterium]
MHQIVFDGEEGRNLPAPQDIGGRKHPAGMADCRYNLARFMKIPHQLDHRPVTAHMIRGVSTRNDKTMEFAGADVVHALIGLDGETVLAGIVPAGFGSHHTDLDSGFFQSVIGIPELPIVIEGFDKDDDFFIR